MRWSRRELLKAGIGVGASIFLPSGRLPAQTAPLIQRKIPSTGESLPVIGIGTARRYEAVTTEADRAPLREVLRQFKEMGGESHRYRAVVRNRRDGGGRSGGGAQDS